MATITVNGVQHEVSAPGDTPLLYVLRNDLHLSGPQFGCGDHSMRTPGRFQQNYPRELAISEAAAPAGADAIQFRLDHAKEERLISVLKEVRDASGWDNRPSPRHDAVSTGSTAVRGRGVSVMFRSGTYRACVCQIAVTPSTGAIGS